MRPPLPTHPLRSPLAELSTAPCAAFPHDQFNDSGLEAARFKWSQAEEFTRHDADTEDFKLRSYLRPLVRLPPAGAASTQWPSWGPAHVPAEALWAHAARAGRQDLGSDWLHVSSPPVYAYQMSIRKRLLEECPELVLISDPQVILPTAPGVSNEGRSSPLLALAPPFLGPGFRLGAR